MLDWQTQGTIIGGTDVETQRFWLTKKEKMTWKSDKCHQKILRDYSEKIQVCFFFLFLTYWLINLVCKLIKKITRAFSITLLFFCGCSIFTILSPEKKVTTECMDCVDVLKQSETLVLKNCEIFFLFLSEKFYSNYFWLSVAKSVSFWPFSLLQ